MQFVANIAVYAVEGFLVYLSSSRYVNIGFIEKAVVDKEACVKSPQQNLMYWGNQMAVKSRPPLMNFRFEDEYREMILSLGVKYRTGNMTQILKRIIEKEYQAQIINPQTQTNKEG